MSYTHKHRCEPTLPSLLTSKASARANIDSFSTFLQHTALSYCCSCCYIIVVTLSLDTLLSFPTLTGWHLTVYNILSADRSRCFCLMLITSCICLSCFTPRCLSFVCVVYFFWSPLSFIFWHCILAKLFYLIF